MQLALLGVLLGAGRQAGPLRVVDLVEGHARQRLAGRDLHPQQEVDLPAGLVQDVRHGVAALGHAQRRVTQRRVRPGPLRPLEGVDQLPGGDPAVDHVLALVAGVVPAAAHVQAVVADARLARHRGVALVGGHPEVPGRAGVGGAGQRGVDRDAAALLVEERHAVGAQAVVERGRDVERVARLPVHDQREARAAAGVGGEVHELGGVARGRVGAVDDGGPGGDARAGGGAQLPAERCGGGADDGGALRAVRQVAELVDPDGRAGVRGGLRRERRGGGLGPEEGRAGRGHGQQQGAGEEEGRRAAPGGDGGGDGRHCGGPFVGRGCAKSRGRGSALPRPRR